MGQNMTINMSLVFMFLETISLASLSNKTIQQVDHALIRIPSNFKSNLSNNTPISLRVCLCFSICLYKIIKSPSVHNAATSSSWWFWI
jgi:hypothetical protein